MFFGLFKTDREKLLEKYNWVTVDNKKFPHLFRKKDKPKWFSGINVLSISEDQWYFYNEFSDESGNKDLRGTSITESDLNRIEFYLKCNELEEDENEYLLNDA